MELSNYLRILRRRGWIIVALAVLLAAAGYGYSQLQTPVYQSTNRLLIISRPNFGQTQTAQISIRNYAQWLNSSLRAQRVIETLGLEMAPRALLGQVEITPSTSESMITIAVRNTDPDLANDIARVWGERLVQWRQEENKPFRREDWITVRPIDNPTYTLYRPQTEVNTAAGAVFGALLGIAVIFVLEWVESGVIRRHEDVERYLDMAVIGNIPKH